MTLQAFDQFPGRSRGYGHLPDEVRRQIVRDVPLWSEFIRQEAERAGCPYMNVDDFGLMFYNARWYTLKLTTLPNPTALYQIIQSASPRSLQLRVKQPSAIY